MEFEKVITDRYSVRDYSDREIEQEKLDKIIEAGMLAPTAKNIQPQRVYVLKSEEALEKIRGLSRCAFNAPVVLLVGYDESEQWTNSFEAGISSGVEDASIVATHMMLEAQNLGLGTCWVNLFKNSEVETAFNLPDSVRSVLLMPLGYASEKAHPAPLHETRRATEEVVKYL